MYTPCPFCGSTNIGERTSASCCANAGGAHIYWLECRECRANGPIGSTKQEAVERWQGRTEVKND